MSIDPIPVREELQRIHDEQARLVRRSNGGLALAWLSDHALSKTGSGQRTPLQGVLQERLTVVASGTTHADKVAPYIQRAYREAQRGIILRAIELARADYESGSDCES
ncbi:hypothetical protein [Novosphingobium guangzhouense]|uniref:Uncharacterized protein n=1 Tax=Novosphingobium guangzhouense TaxID=1850347 RepID=A0A2K2FYT7_9SPHN|nr:hypothetical protein [Novosphingobium guangzhouense]PNU03943.1 hypothetical protein A8V01_04795 [Novosphingobium guangzhouense]